MTDQIIRINEPEEDGSHLATPIASHQQRILFDDPDETEVIDPSYAKSAVPNDNLPLEENDVNEDADPRVLVLPVPASSGDATAEGYPTTMLVSLDSLPADAETSGITVGAESRFVETSSGVIARELKRLYDQHIGAGKDASVRSPFVIAAFVNQHGKQMYRVGRRDMAPLGNPHDLDVGVPQVHTGAESAGSSPPATSASNVPQGRRRSRVSVYSFFKHGPAQPSSRPAAVQDGNRSPPTQRPRRTRSIPNMASVPGPDPTASPITPTHYTGRPHAHSVSSVDAFRPTSLPPPATDPPSKAPPVDTFAAVMSWNSVPSSPLSSGSVLRSAQSSHSASERPFDFRNNDQPPDLIQHPFGRRILFDSPVQPSPLHLHSPPVLREMQSFESGLTARADPSSRTLRLGKLRTRLSDESVNMAEEPETDQVNVPPEPQPAVELLAETSIYSRFSTELFDVLQNYKGLPVLDMVADIPDPPTIKLSLNADNSAVPRDDPRFVIWGEADGDEADDASASRSATDLASVHSHVSRRRSTRERRSTAASERPSIQTPSSESPKRVLVAATIERWIAQLTSELNYDELLIFFLTYRTYISALDLGHLLICRFHWALGEPRSPQDDMIRRIVRARTFIAIRYWLLTFFNADFVPNRDLRRLFADWLNALRKDPILSRHKDAPSIVQKLRKVALDLKDGHTQGQNARKRSEEKTNTGPPPSVDFSQGDFGENLRRAVGKGDEDADIDLDFDGVPQSDVEFALNLATSPSGKLATTVDLAMMQRASHLTYLQLGKQSTTVTETDILQAQLPLPVPHSALSRVVVNAIGRLGRWKRVLNYRAMNTRGAPSRSSLSAACIDASSFDLDASETGDLLLERGGVEKYLKMLERQTGRRPAPGGNFLQTLSAPPPLGLVPTVASMSSSTTSASPSQTALESLPETPDESSSVDGDPQLTAEQVRPVSVASSTATESVRFRHSMSNASTRTRQPWQMDVVSIDDLELSDLSSEDLRASPPPTGLKKLGRRLPNRRDFEFVRRSIDSVSSMGIHTNHGHDSVLSTGSSVASSASAGPDFAGPIHEWQMTALVNSLSDDEEPGDVEAALRRLEGQINRDKQKQKQTKVDAWVQSINNKQRQPDGRRQSELQRYSSDEEDYGEVTTRLRQYELGQASSSHASSRSSISSAVSPPSVVAPSQALGPALPPGLGHSPKGSVQAATVGETIDSADQTSRSSRPTSTPSAVHTPAAPMNPLIVKTDISGFVKPEKNLKRHRSFVLSYKSEAIVHHFSVIDRDLFVSLKFDELISPEWMSSTEDFNILDWAQYVRERHEMKIERRGTTSALTVIRNRFNLTGNFVSSEIVLTHPTERVMVYSKFVRIAWKAYMLKNYHLLVAVLAGLDSVWVQQALKQTQAKKPGIWENRMLRDLRQWSVNQDDFKHIRNAVDALAEAKSRTVGSPEASQVGIETQSATSRGRATSEVKPLPPPSCVPFFGIYLSQLHRFNSLPDLIDPTAPHETVGVDLETGALEPPAHPEVFSYLAPLPPSVQLEPLINVHKQRLVAGVVKSFVAGQHLATKVDFPVERKLFQKCFKLRGLESDTLQRILALYSGRES